MSDPREELLLAVYRDVAEALESRPWFWLRWLRAPAYREWRRRATAACCRACATLDGCGLEPLAYDMLLEKWRRLEGML